MKIIRVFPRRTKATPTDDYAFIGDPPMSMIRLEADEIHVSATFTWDVETARRLADAWAQYYPIVKLGGPALHSPCNEFIPGQYIKPGVTFTSRGCNNKCPPCLVPEWEGKLQLLEIKPGHIINDNNLLQCPRQHIEKVFQMLRRVGHSAEFKGGLDSRLLADWIVEELRSIKIRSLFFAADTREAVKPLEKAVHKLNGLRRQKLRCYVLLGFRNQTLAEAEERLQTVWDLGCLPFPQLYQPPGKKRQKYGAEWMQLAHKSSRSLLVFQTQGKSA